MKSRTFEDLIVWRKAHEWVIAIYKLTGAFPREEQFGLTAQLRRAAVSVPANIVEGFKKRGKLDKNRFYNIAQSSIEESRYYLMLAQDLGYGDTKLVLTKLEEVSRLLESYMKAVGNG